MLNKSDTNTLLQAVSEIRELRRRNEILTAKVEVMDLFALVLHTSPAFRGMGMSEDIAWKIERLVEDHNEPKETD